MGNSQPQAPRTGSGREIALLVGVLLLVGAGTVATYWVRSRAEASGQGAAAETTLETGSPVRPRAAAPAPIHAEAAIHDDIYFDFKSARLRADAARLLQDRVAAMDPSHAWAVLVHGYADRQGPAGYNRLLAERRAQAVRQFLVELGVPEASIRVVTIGPEGALCEESTAACRQLDRRVHLEFRRLARTGAEPVRPTLVVGDTLDTTAGPGERQ
jgi:peptidoglycan-associated lipoprotein